MSKYRKECWTDADVRCPFYISDERSARSITCEGCMEETKATMSFRTLANRDGHMGRFCVGTYERCPVYRSVYQSKYADGEALLTRRRATGCTSQRATTRGYRGGCSATTGHMAVN